MNLLLNQKYRSRFAFFALSGLLTVAGVRAQEASNSATPKDEKAVTLDKYEVTGSRIKRLDTETVSPVLQMTAEQINVQGFTSVGDALRSMPYNSGQALTPTDSGTSFTPGVSTINLRGLGNNSTLVLLNGRRGVPYASPGFNGFQTVFDLNSIPFAAIEKIEILKDGGSALYGSDAVAGVVNVKLRRDFEGLTTSLKIGDYFRTNGFLKQATAIVGTSSAKTSIVVAMNWQEQDSVFARDLPYTRNADKTEFKSQGNAYWTVHGFEKAGYASAQAYFADIEFTNPIDDGWVGNLNSSRGFPGYVTVKGKRYTFASPTNNPTVAGAKSGTNPYNYQVENGLFPSSRMFSFYTSLRHEITDNIYAFSELSFSRSEQEVYSASTPADMETSHGLSSGTAGTTEGMHIPSFNPYNPWQVDIYNGRRRLFENGPRINDVTSDTPRLLAGLGGKINESWSWEAAAMYTKNTINNLNRGTVPDYRMQQALMGLTRNSNGTLSWDPTTPLDGRVYYNWFGQNEPAFSQFLTVENPNSSSLEYLMFDASATGTIFEGLPSGPIGLAIGGEHRQEKFSNVKSDLNATGNVLGGSEGTSSFGSRNLSAIYAEAQIPLLKNLPFVQSLEAQLAGRYEQYSDKGFAKQIRPKMGLKYRPLDWLIFRASYSKSFKAPDMAYLYTASQTSFTSAQIHDPVTDEEIDQLQIVTGGNRELHPELTDTYYAGFTIAPQGKLKGLDVSVDMFRFQQKNLLAQLSDFYGYSQFLSEAAAGNPLFNGKVVRDGGTNEVLFIRDDYANISGGQYRGIDVEVSYLWKNVTLGNIYAGVKSTWIDTNQVNEEEFVGSYLVARWNGTATLSWDKGDWEVTLFGVYRGRREYHTELGSWFYDDRDHDLIYLNYNLKAQYTQNVSVTYRGLRNLELSVGVNNLFDSQPPVDFNDGTGTTSGVNDPYPSFWYARAEYKF